MLDTPMGLLRADRVRRLVACPSPKPDAGCQERQGRLEGGQAPVLYTDGLTKARRID